MTKKPINNIIEAEWARLGILLNCPLADRTPDLERLLLETSRQVRTSARLLPLVVSWLSRYSNFVARHRLKQLILTELERRHQPAMGLILESAISHGAAKDLHFAVDVCDRIADEGPLHDAYNATEPLRRIAEHNASDLSRKWGVWTPEFNLKTDAIRPVSWLLKHNPDYRARIIRKGDLRASILETLRLDTDSGQLASESEVARRCGATRRGTKQALEALELEGEIEITDGGSRRSGCSVRYAFVA